MSIKMIKPEEVAKIIAKTITDEANPPSEKLAFSIMDYAEDLAGLEAKAYRAARSGNRAKAEKCKSAAERILDHIALMVIVEAELSTKEWRERLTGLLTKALGVLLTVLLSRA